MNNTSPETSSPMVNLSWCPSKEGNRSGNACGDEGAAFDRGSGADAPLFSRSGTQVKASAAGRLVARCALRDPLQPDHRDLLAGQIRTVDWHPLAGDPGRAFDRAHEITAIGIAGDDAHRSGNRAGPAC